MFHLYHIKNRQDKQLLTVLKYLIRNKNIYKMESCLNKDCLTKENPILSKKYYRRVEHR